MSVSSLDSCGSPLTASCPSDQIDNDEVFPFAAVSNSATQNAACGVSPTLEFATSREVEHWPSVDLRTYRLLYHGIQQTELPQQPVGDACFTVPGGIHVPHNADAAVYCSKKERRRTHSINSAFAELRQCIPNVPGDTKLSKIKTLRLAISYIQHLMICLEGSEIDSAFQFPNNELCAISNSDSSSLQLTEADSLASMRRALVQHGTLFCPICSSSKPKQDGNSRATTGKKQQQQQPGAKTKTTKSNAGSRGNKRLRTGWPQYVWALELTQ